MPSFGIDGVARRWFKTYLTGRLQSERRGLLRSTIQRLPCGVPQGSVLGPILFVLYTADLILLVKNSGLLPHLYADDSQVYGSCRPSAVDAFSARVTVCLGAVAKWMQSNRLQLNSDKTEVIWRVTGRRQNQLQLSTPDTVSVSLLVRELKPPYVFRLPSSSSSCHFCQCVSGVASE